MASQRGFSRGLVARLKAAFGVPHNHHDFVIL
jgi:hypothetical protein